MATPDFTKPGVERFWVDGYHQLGERIVTENNLERTEIYGKKILSDLSKSIGVPIRTLYRAIQFYGKYPELDEVPEGKNITATSIPHAREGKNTVVGETVSPTKTTADIATEAGLSVLKWSALQAQMRDLWRRLWKR